MYIGYGSESRCMNMCRPTFGPDHDLIVLARVQGWSELALNQWNEQQHRSRAHGGWRGSIESPFGYQRHWSQPTWLTSRLWTWKHWGRACCWIRLAGSWGDKMGWAGWSLGSHCWVIGIELSWANGVDFVRIGKLKRRDWGWLCQGLGQAKRLLWHWDSHWRARREKPLLALVQRRRNEYGLVTSWWGHGCSIMSCDSPRLTCGSLGMIFCMATVVYSDGCACDMHISCQQWRQLTASQIGMVPHKICSSNFHVRI